METLKFLHETCTPLPGKDHKSRMGGPLYGARRTCPTATTDLTALADTPANPADTQRRSRKRAVVHVLRPGDVDGDIERLLDMPLPYTARALTDSVCLFLTRPDFESLTTGHPTIARRWPSSVAGRLATSQMRIVGLLGRSLVAQVAQLLLDFWVGHRSRPATRQARSMSPISAAARLRGRRAGRVNVAGLIVVPTPQG